MLSKCKPVLKYNLYTVIKVESPSMTIYHVKKQQQQQQQTNKTKNIQIWAGAWTDQQVVATYQISSKWTKKYENIL